jgi:thymidylate synthase
MKLEQNLLIADTSLISNELQYLKLIKRVLEEGEQKGDRTGTGTRSLHFETLKISLKDTFPIYTTKKVSYKMAIAEMLCFRDGKTDVKDFQAMGVPVWNEFADKKTGELGKIYGSQWREWPGVDSVYDEDIDQLRDVLTTLLKNPTSRRMVVTAWNPTFHPPESAKPYDNPKEGFMSLTACHAFWQLLTRKARQSDLGANSYSFSKLNERGSVEDQLTLNMMVYIRSNDLGLGNPFNVTQYSFLLCAIAHTHGMIPGVFTVNIGDAHIYNNHVDALTEQLTRVPFAGPTIKFNPDKRIPGEFFELGMDDFVVEGYQSHDAIKMVISV